MKRSFRFAICLAAALASAAAIGALDLRASEVQPVVLLILISSALLSLAMPNRAWLWAILLGTCVLGAHLWNRAAGNPEPYPVEPNVLATLLALIPSSVGALAGAGARRLWANRGIGA